MSARLPDFGSVRYKALIYTYRTILLALKVKIASGCGTKGSRNFLVFFNVFSVGLAYLGVIALSATSMVAPTVQA